MPNHLKESPANKKQNSQQVKSRPNASMWCHKRTAPGVPKHRDLFSWLFLPLTFTQLTARVEGAKVWTSRFDIDDGGFAFYDAAARRCSTIPHRVTCILRMKLDVHHANTPLLLYINGNSGPSGRKTTRTIQGVHKWRITFDTFSCWQPCSLFSSQCLFHKKNLTSFF